MSTETTVPVITDLPAPKNALIRKALIVAGAATGLIIAGGLLFAAKNASDEDGLDAGSETTD